MTPRPQPRLFRKVRILEFRVDLSAWAGHPPAQARYTNLPAASQSMNRFSPALPMASPSRKGIQRPSSSRSPSSSVSGPFLGFSEAWQLVINTGTTIITFLMVFIIRNAQNRDGAAIQAKLDEPIRSSMAQNTFIGIEHLRQEEVEELR
jgi:low affinity Fe/Cu permease